VKNTNLTLALLSWLASIPAMAQPPLAPQTGPVRPPVEIDKTPPTEDFKPSALNAVINGRISPYPEVNSQRRVRTRLRAPNAQSVLLDIPA